MNPTVIGIKQLHKELTRVSNAAQKGKSFIVMKHAKPVFRIEPVREQNNKPYTLEDLKKIQFTLPKRDRNLSKRVDQIVYGL